MIELISQVDVSNWVSVANTAGSIVVVLLFLQYLNKRKTSNDLLETRRMETNDLLESKRLEALKHISDECHAHSRALTESFINAVSKNDVALAENTRVLGRLEKALDEIEGQV